MAGDTRRVVRVLGGTPPGRVSRILALLRYQIRLISSSIAVVAAKVKYRGRTGKHEHNYLIQRTWGSSLAALRCRSNRPSTLQFQVPREDREGAYRAVANDYENSRGRSSPLITGVHPKLDPRGEVV
jgi:hypothetical protein